MQRFISIYLTATSQKKMQVSFERFARFYLTRYHGPSRVREANKLANEGRKDGLRRTPAEGIACEGGTGVKSDERSEEEVINKGNQWWEDVFNHHF